MKKKNQVRVLTWFFTVVALCIGYARTTTTTIVPNI